jgi:hypothetical protein
LPHGACFLASISAVIRVNQGGRCMGSTFPEYRVDNRKRAPVWDLDLGIWILFLICVLGFVISTRPLFQRLPPLHRRRSVEVRRLRMLSRWQRLSNRDIPVFVCGRILQLRQRLQRHVRERPIRPPAEVRVIAVLRVLAASEQQTRIQPRRRRQRSRSRSWAAGLVMGLSRGRPAWSRSQSRSWVSPTVTETATAPRPAAETHDRDRTGSRTRDRDQAGGRAPRPRPYLSAFQTFMAVDP